MRLIDVLVLVIIAVAVVVAVKVYRGKPSCCHEKKSACSCCQKSCRKEE